MAFAVALRSFVPIVALLASCSVINVFEEVPEGASTSSPGSGGATSSSVSSASSGGTGGMDPPLTCSEAYTNLPSGDCDLLDQNCPAGQGCVPLFEAGAYTTTCWAKNGGMGPGAVCANDGDCETGLFCNFDRCSGVCCPKTDEPCDEGPNPAGELRLCVYDYPVGSNYVAVCGYLEPCEILTTDACSGGNDCHVIFLGESSYTACIPPSVPQKNEGEACEYLNECGANQTCYIPTGITGFCRYSCFLDGSGEPDPGLGGCPVAQSCTDVSTGVENVGVCLP